MSGDYYGSLAGSSLPPSSSTSAGNNNQCTSTRWLTEEVFALIDLVQRNEAIYNPRHKYYFCRPYVENFWREVDLKLEKNPGASLAKWTNLRISFRREYTNYLEEKVPPCWTYFDRMFFLHPYLRKKHQQSKSLDSQVQDALVQISSLSNRLQRERAVAAAAAASSLGPTNNTAASSPSQPQLDNYLEYFDDPENNPSELDDMIDEEHPNSSQFAHSTLANDIKSECEDNNDEYDNVERPGDEDDLHEADGEADMRNFDYQTEKRQTPQHHQRLQNLQRLQSRPYYEEFRNKRARSQDSISSSQAFGTPPSINNVSFVRPTFTKPLDVVSTTTTTQSHNSSSGRSNNNSNSSGSNNSTSLSNTDVEPVSNSSAITTTRSSTQQHHHVPYSTPTMPHAHHNHHHSARYEISNLNSQPSLATNGSSAATSGGHQFSNGLNNPLAIAAPTASTPELCDCKTDPDAMFLMSLLPDIQKLNGRDRGKIKIAFQNILQDYLYPD
uniref:Alcohol dehydrogenase transcription factor n=1 Tax=Musca domestica TaxID=7370 RepID=T1P8C7_MUSDO